MKIAHVVNSLEVGGAEVLVDQMARLQRSQGHEIYLFALDRLGDLGSRLLADGFKVTCGMSRNIVDGNKNFYRFFRKEHFDVVHMHNTNPTACAAPAAWLAGIPRRISTRHSLVAKPRDAGEEFKYRLAARFCHQIVGICEATVLNLKDARTAPKAKLSCIYNGIRSLTRAPRNLLPESRGVTFLFVGRLAPVKNLSFMLKAFAQVMAGAADVRLWIVGDGEERSALEGLATHLGIADRVHFWGQQLDVAPFFSAADAFVMSSHSEGLPISLLQAFSMALPSIVTEVGGMAEAVLHARAGIVVPPSNPAAMAKAITQMAISKHLRESFGSQAQSAFSRYFTLDAMNEKYMALYARH